MEWSGIRGKDFDPSSYCHREGILPTPGIAMNFFCYAADLRLRYAIAVAEVSGMPKTVIDYALRVRDTLQAEATSDDAQTCTCGNPEQTAMLLAEKLFHLKHSTLDTESKRAYLKKLKEDLCKSL
ncbi:hypothetical protein Pelo_19441 [Pelomyxa schiedti]|nr:hypothetical protein Pelo_19441 [Pelomyxa schiedti]